MYLYIFHVISLRRPYSELELVVLVEIQMFIFYVLLFIFIYFYHDCIFINFYSNAAHKFPVYGTIKFYCIVLYCIGVYHVQSWNEIAAFSSDKNNYNVLCHTFALHNYVIKM